MDSNPLPSYEGQEVVSSMQVDLAKCTTLHEQKREKKLQEHLVSGKQGKLSTTCMWDKKVESTLPQGTHVWYCLRCKIVWVYDSLIFSKGGTVICPGCYLKEAKIYG